MPAESEDEYIGIWRSTEKKLIDTTPIDYDNDTDHQANDDDDSNGLSILDDSSTYYLEDDISISDITPLEYDESLSDENTGNSVEAIPHDPSSEEIIPKYLFSLPSATRALNIEFNRCLLIDLESVCPPSGHVQTEDNKQTEDKKPEPQIGIYPYSCVDLEGWSNGTCSCSYTDQGRSTSDSSLCTCNRALEIAKNEINKNQENFPTTDCDIIINPSNNMIDLFPDPICFRKMEYKFITLSKDNDEDSQATDRDVSDQELNSSSSLDNFLLDTPQTTTKISDENEVLQKDLPSPNSSEIDSTDHSSTDESNIPH